MTAENKNNGFTVTVYTFGFKHGLPADIDMIFDARFLPNPFYVPELKHLTGLDKEIGDFLYPLPQTKEFLRLINELLAFIVEQCKSDGRDGLTAAIGCTGGRHRSVAVAKAVCDHIEAKGNQVVMFHRDIKK